jgi:hypothetical protein
MNFEQASQIDAVLDLDALFTACEHTQALHGKRDHGHAGDAQTLLDRFEGANCLFLRTAGVTRFRLVGDYRLLRSAAGGWLLQSREDAAPSYWLPVQAILRRLDGQGHVLEERDAELEHFDLDGSGMGGAFAAIPEGWSLDAVIWRIDSPALINELEMLSPIETQGYFSWGSHTRYRRPADIYLHLIHGYVYERRYAWPFNRKICSENDAHALFVTLEGLRKSTGKQLYKLLADQIILATLARQSPDGGWRHGEWTQEMEAHYRLNASALHLLMDAWSERPDPVVGAAMARAAAFLAKRSDRVAGATWFLHDELEHDPARLNQGPFRWLRSRAFGKSESNMLVLNTQLDTSVALDRYHELSGDATWAPEVASALQATRAVLAARPAEWLYRPLFAAIRLTFLPTERAAALPLPLRALKRIAWKYLLPRLPAIKVRYPRLVMPGGYVDRELCVRTWAHHYLTINLMDLARHQRRFPEADQAQVIHDALGYARDSGILARWKELKYEKYALGFWAEALYHLCRLAPDDLGVRRLLADAMLDLSDLGLGLPPSLLGANAEAIPPELQAPCPTPADPTLLIANLGDASRPEWLLVNPGSTPCPAGPGTWRSLAGAAVAKGEALPARTAWLGGA